MKKIYLSAIFLLCALFANAQNVIYSNNFENGLGDGVTQVGTGAIVADAAAGFGNVYHNVADGTQAIRTNYLQLPATIFADVAAAGTNEMTIAFWVNLGTATGNHWSPLFSAYAGAPDATTGNTWPMFILQTRLLAQLNNAGWCDFTAVQNVNAANVESSDWLVDGAWHYYTCTYTQTSVKIYVDGVVQNEWTLDNATDGQVIGGMFTNGGDLSYICLGGNQAWDWGDIDPAYKFDDFTVFSAALTKEQIDAAITAKTTITATNNLVAAQEVVSVAYYNIIGVYVGADYNGLVPNVYIKKEVYRNGTSKTTKICKAKY